MTNIIKVEGKNRRATNRREICYKQIHTYTQSNNKYKIKYKQNLKEISQKLRRRRAGWDWIFFINSRKIYFIHSKALFIQMIICHGIRQVIQIYY